MPVSIRDVMTSDPATVSPDTPLREVAEVLIEDRYSGLPVCEGDSVVGVVEVHDLLPKSGQVPFTRVPVLEFQDEWIEEDQLVDFAESLGRMTVEEVMDPDPLTIAPDASVGEALRKLVTEDVRRLLVVDEDGALLGVATRKDLLRLLAGGV